MLYSVRTEAVSNAEDSMAAGQLDTDREQARSPREIFVVFLRLGLTSFGGPIAHLGYFRDESCGAANGSTKPAMPIWWRCASSCPGRPPARSASPSACCAATGCLAALPRGPVSPCHRRCSWSPSPLARVIGRPFGARHRAWPETRRCCGGRTGVVGHGQKLTPDLPRAANCSRGHCRSAARRRVVGPDRGHRHGRCCWSADLPGRTIAVGGHLAFPVRRSSAVIAFFLFGACSCCRRSRPPPPIVRR